MNISLESVNINEKSEIKLLKRNITINLDMVGETFAIHNGVRFFKIKITSEMVGLKAGSFSPTRKKVIHKVVKVASKIGKKKK